MTMTFTFTYSITLERNKLILASKKHKRVGLDKVTESYRTFTRIILQYTYSS